jgi:hypothetical protein
MPEISRRGLFRALIAAPIAVAVGKPLLATGDWPVKWTVGKVTRVANLSREEICALYEQKIDRIVASMQSCFNQDFTDQS